MLYNIKYNKSLNTHPEDFNQKLIMSRVWSFPE